MNYSRQRELVLNTLKENVVHPTAEYIQSVINSQGGNISLATLYRNLNQLADAGIIKKIDGLDASAHYDHNTFAHYHFICTGCGKVFDVNSDVAPNLVANVQNETGFIVQQHDVVLRGLCRECSSKNKGD